MISPIQKPFPRFYGWQKANFIDRTPDGLYNPSGLALIRFDKEYCVGSIIQAAWERFRIIGEINGDYVARVFAMVFYFTILLPFAYITRFAVDPLGLRKTDKPTWKARKPVGVTLDDARSQS